MLLGLGGNDELRGGMGNDVYVHGRRDGHDEIVEAGGDFDLIRFGEGITQRHGARATPSRRSGARRRRPARQRDGQGWFASQARRVEFVQFAGGAVWDEQTFAGWCAKAMADSTLHSGDSDRGRESKPSRSAEDDRQAVVDWYRSRDASAASIRQRLSAPRPFDFDALLRQPGSTQAAPDAQEIARQWARAHSYDERAHVRRRRERKSAWQGAAAKLAGTSATGFGFEASIGAARAQEGLRTLEGLTEGFRKL